MSRLVLPVLTPAASATVAHLAGDGRFDVVAVAVDVGQTPALDGVRDAALVAGASRCHVVDRRDTLAEAVLWPALRVGAIAVPGAPVLTALSMPVVADAVAEVARYEGASAVAAWADDALDRQRLRALLRTAAPGLGIVSVPQGTTGPARNLWATVRIADTTASRTAPGAASTAAARLRVGFERGVPVSLNGVNVSPAEMIDSLATIAADHGVAPCMVRDEATGATWQVDAPAAQVLHQAMQALVARVADAPTHELLDTLAPVYATLVRDGAWYSPARAGIDACVDRLLAHADGEITLHISDGRIEGDA
ncbi:MAG: argininosuccinate synthase [Vicinamibacterales bacterium]